MSLDLIIIIIAAIAVVSLVFLSITVLAGARDALERAIGIHVLDRLTRRPTAPPADTVGPGAALTAEEVSYRIGVPDAPIPVAPDIPPPAPSGAAATAAAARAAAAAHIAATTERPTIVQGDLIGVGDESIQSPPARRDRLMRDAGYALIALSAFALVAMFVWPHGQVGPPTPTSFAVTRVDPTATAKAGATGAASATARAAASAKATAAPATSGPTADPTPAATPSPIATATPPAITKSTPKPTARPTLRPTPTPSATPTPKPTATPTPKPTPTPPLGAHISVSAQCGDPGVTITFTASSMPGATYTWAFDDGGDSGRVVQHQFNAAGAYTVILEVKRSGDVQGDTVTIDVPC